ncbi:glycosyl hydrolase family 28-related protein [Caenimonas aquaedulcis]|uniref:Rhamnogalacturonase A/B/Epimerase-like pectate lyase domain-containing protein n=1 Tax=Caenimonas aquaedulcis TaxID=2793270 RepID=A0A931H3Z6_9BURK|nr:glycosyl hydrolase family 28-related protein [Caenimonas aquaedulcis]MBG9388180.1 hypothetical protein [Caenimonas aquaedulcis]
MKRILLMLAFSVGGAIAQGTATPVQPGTAARGVGGGAAASRPLPDPVPERINVKEFGAVGDATTDNTSAFDAAVSRANALRAAGTRACIYIPSGNFKIHAAFTQFAPGNPGCIVGEGPHQSKIILDAGFSGTLFSWTEAWYQSNYGPDTGPSTDDRVGPSVRGIGVQGDKRSPHIQNAFVFYDRNDGVVMEDVAVYFLHGRAWHAGVTRTMPLAFMRESEFRNLTFWQSGTESLPVMEIDSSGTGDSSNQLVFYNVNILRSVGKGLFLHNSANTSKGTGNIRFFGLRTESGGDDLFTIGSESDRGKAVNNISVYGFIGNASAKGFHAIRITAPNKSLAPYNILIDGTITSGAGGGINIDAARSIQISMRQISTQQTHVTVGPSTKVGNNINFNAHGNERNLTYRIDPSSLKNFLTPAAPRVGDPSVAN